jgi:5S rRNA maturation endonuclease (ribonuclease M5)
MIPKIKNLIQNYQKVELYFDNDNAGNRAVEMIKNAGENIEDCRILYKPQRPERVFNELGNA